MTITVAERVAPYAQAYGAHAADVARTARVTPGNRAYQGAILAEYLAAVLLVTLSPIAKPSGEPKQGPSPYGVNDLRQLVAVSATYFVLALLSSGERLGRAAAWIGGLILLTIGISKMGTGQLTAVFRAAGQQPETTGGESAPVQVT